MSFFPKPSGKRVAMTFVSERRKSWSLSSVFQLREDCIFHVAAEVVDTPPSHIKCSVRMISSGENGKEREKADQQPTMILEHL